MDRPVAVVTGVGPGTGSAIVRRLAAGGYDVALLSRSHWRLAPAMVERGAGAIVATGNTSALRGRANFAGFAPTKAAQRILAEAMARDLGPKGVHVAYIVIDAVID